MYAHIVRNIRSPLDGRRRPLFVSEATADAWVTVDERVLGLLRQELPRLPAGAKVANLNFSGFDVVDLPGGLRCDQLNLSGTAIRALPANLEVRDVLDLSNCRRLTGLPRGLTVRQLTLRGCTALPALPRCLNVGQLDLTGCTALTALPPGLRCGELDLEGTRLYSLPDDLHVQERLSLRDCRQLVALPGGLRVRLLDLRGCSALQALPPNLDVFDLDLSGCSGLARWPESARVRHGRLICAGCGRLPALSRRVTELEALDLRDCVRLRALPRLRVRQWLDVANTGLRGLPQSLRGVQLRWRGVDIDERIAFRPEELQVNDILGERNAERRRVMLERFGFGKFMTTAGAEVLDKDTDAGGFRQLLRVRVPGDADLVSVAVRCPSTGRHYLLRVPPEMRNCRQAVAWTAGFDNADAYAPLVET